jgi:hypothetical protein
MSKGHYRHQSAVDLSAPLPAGIAGEPVPPVEPRRPAHEAGCWCIECWNAGIEYGIYLQAKRLEEL